MEGQRVWAAGVGGRLSAALTGAAMAAAAATNLCAAAAGSITSRSVHHHQAPPRTAASLPAPVRSCPLRRICIHALKHRVPQALHSLNLPFTGLRRAGCRRRRCTCSMGAWWARQPWARAGRGRDCSPHTQLAMLSWQSPRRAQSQAAGHTLLACKPASRHPSRPVQPTWLSRTHA